MFQLEEDGSSAGGSTTGNSSSVSGLNTSGGKTSNDGPFTTTTNETSRDSRGTPPPSGILVPVVGQMNNSGVVLLPRTFPQQPISSSPHSHCSSHLSGNGFQHVSFECRRVACKFNTTIYTGYLSICLFFDKYSIII